MESKYKIGQKLFFLHKGKVAWSFVKAIEIHIFQDYTEITYLFSLTDNSEWIHFNENEVFEKEDDAFEYSQEYWKKEALKDFEKTKIAISSLIVSVRNLSGNVVSAEKLFNKAFRMIADFEDEFQRKMKE